MATLTIQLPGLPPVSHVLKDDTITVGRMKANNIVIEDVSVSLTHARITRKNGEFYLKDLNSTNGTVVNGQRINEAKLHDSDRVVFADISAQFQSEAAAEAGVSAPAPAPAPIAPAIAKYATQPAPAPVAAAPSRAAAAPAALAATSRTDEGRAPAFNFMRLVTRAVSILGGAVAVGVVSFLGWKMLHGGFDSSAGPKAAQAPVDALVAVKPATEAPKKTVTPAAVPDNPQPVAPANPATAAPAASDSGAQSVAKLALALRDPDPAERRRAATALHSIGVQAKDASAELREALKDTDQDVRMWAALTLVNNELHDKATIPILIGVLQRENPVLRQVACLSLGLIPYEDYEKNTVVPALAETASKDGDDEVRKAAVSALNIIAPDAAARVGIK
jgi:predicted component of type VI protein secretion system